MPNATVDIHTVLVYYITMEYKDVLFAFRHGSKLHMYSYDSLDLAHMHELYIYLRITNFASKSFFFNPFLFIIPVIY